MKKKTIEKIEWLAKCDAKHSYVVAADIYYINGQKHLIIDLAKNDKKTIRLVATDKETGAYIPEYSPLIGHEKSKYRYSRYMPGWTSSDLYYMDLHSAVQNKTGYIKKEDYIKPYLDKKSAKKIDEFLGKEEHSVYEGFVLFRMPWESKFICYENKLASNKFSEEGTKKKKEKYNSFENLPEIPKKVIKAWKREVTEHIISYSPFLKKKETKGYCSHCKQLILFKKGTIKPRTLTKCPNCGVEADTIRVDIDKDIEGSYSLNGKFKTYKSSGAILLQKLSDTELVERHFNYHTSTLTRAENFSFTETCRLVYDYTTRRIKTFTKEWNSEKWKEVGSDSLHSGWEKVFFNEQELVHMDWVKESDLVTHLYESKKLNRSRTPVNYLDINNPEIKTLKNNGIDVSDMFERKQLNIAKEPINILGIKPKSLELLKEWQDKYNRVLTDKTYKWLKFVDKKNLDVSIKNLDELCNYVTPREVSFLLDRMSLNEICEMLNGIEFYNRGAFLKQLRMFPQLELLVKSGLTNLAKNYNHQFSLDCKTIYEALQINREQFNRLKAINGDYNALAWLQNENNTGKRIKDEDLNWFVEQRFKPKDLSFILDKMTYTKIKNYINKQEENAKKIKRYCTAHSIVNEWRDFLSMAEFFKMDTTKEYVFKPKNVFEAHDELAGMKALFDSEEKMKAREEEILEKFSNLNEVCANIKSLYEYNDGEYAVVVPNSVRDIIAEGIALGHCLDRSDIYFNRMSTNESYIVFLRKAKDIDKPYYTMEIEPDGTARQKRTTGDRQNKDFEECLKFIQKWQREVNKRMKAEHKALAKRSKELRDENFKQLRRDQNKIWHGELAGQLLVDVLEADLMEAVKALEMEENDERIDSTCVA